MGYKKKCVVCGNLFATRNDNQICCCWDCSSARAFQKQKKREANKKFKIFMRDNFTCIYCGKNVFEDNIKLEVDHLIPKTEKGINEKSNLVTCCWECNRLKGGIMLSKEVIERIKNVIIINERRLKENGEALQI